MNDPMNDSTNDPSTSGSRWEPTDPPTEPTDSPAQEEAGPNSATPAAPDDAAQFAAVSRGERARTTAASGGRWARARKGLLGGAAALILVGGTAGFAIGQAANGAGDRDGTTPVNVESGVDGDQSGIPDRSELGGPGGQPGRGGPGGPVQGDPELDGEPDSGLSGGAGDPGSNT